MRNFNLFTFKAVGRRIADAFDDAIGLCILVVIIYVTLSL